MGWYEAYVEQPYGDCNPYAQYMVNGRSQRQQRAANYRVLLLTADYSRAEGISKGVGGGGKFHHGAKLSARPDQGDLGCVTWLGFQGDSDANLMSLFVVTESQTLSFNLQTSAKVRDSLQQRAGALHKG
jgi:hypothetical protein